MSRSYRNDWTEYNLITTGFFIVSKVIYDAYLEAKQL